MKKYGINISEKRENSKRDHNGKDNKILILCCYQQLFGDFGDFERS